MAFTLQLADDLVEVEAGGNTPVSVTVVNKGAETDRYEIEIEGIDAEWKAIPVPVFAVEPGETRVERVFVKPPRMSESVAGNYPFVIKVRSLESGDQKSAQGVVHLKPYHHLSLEIDPKKGSISPLSTRNIFEVTVVNLGNTEHTVQLVGTDPEDACTYEFDGEQVTVSPGQQKVVTVTVTPASQPIFASGKLIGFTVSARSVDTPSVVATTQAQLERRSLVTPAGLAVMVLIILIFTAWFLMRPKPPSIMVSATPTTISAGEPVSINWSAQDADHVRIYIITSKGATINVYDGNELVGNTSVAIPDDGAGKVEAEVSRGQWSGPKDTKIVQVDPKVLIPPPIIDSFSASPKTVRKGGTVTFKWKVDNVDRLAISPATQDTLNPSLGSYQVTMNDVGTAEYTLTVFGNDKSKISSDPIKITVTDPSDAKIIAFTADPTTVVGNGATSITWQVTNAVRVELKLPSGASVPENPTGSQSFNVTAKSEFVLTAWDSNGRTTTQRVTVNYTPPPPPTTTGDTAGSTTGITPSTTGAATTTGTTSNPATAGAGR